MLKHSLRLFPRNLRFHSSFPAVKSTISSGRHKYKISVGGLVLGALAGASLGLSEWSIKNEQFSSTTSLEDLQPPQYCHDEKVFDEAVKKLKAILKDDPASFTVSKEELDSHSDSYFNSHHATSEQRPKIILYPHSTQDVSEILKVCHEYNIPVIPFSGGTSLEGHFLPTRIGCTVMVDLSMYMNQIIKLNDLDLDVEVQAGVPWEDLNEFLGEKGLLFGCDPGPGAQIGGCIANSCSGTNAYRYGTMKENVVNITAVLADGTIIKTKKRPRKSSAGYNLNGLLIGSEGTLAVVTEATVKCHVKPMKETVAVGSFPSVGDAAACTSRIIQEGIQLNAMELLDDNMMKVINKGGATYKTDWIEKPTLFFKIGGRNDNIIAEVVSEINRIAKTHGCHKFEFATNDDEKMELWEARKAALWSVINEGKTKDSDINVWTTDVAVPLSQFSKVIEATKEEMTASGLQNAIVGHAGDGNFHAFLLYNDEQRSKASEIVDNMVKRAIDAEGTCTGEHGVGIGKRKFLLEELGDGPVDLMRSLKLAMDPKRILNPDKIFKIDPNDDEE
ncbi:LAME_0C04368g1_1 [Lachancea meyersii CBS 8951]|uniref:D-lactate dehydrogenase (cytochrome) n=1 Tax=Lachancea meyersii CBS 8951 TaxID=1266667 RepID=A0A1G4J0W3_9SACH|nr:LAME_0C04368g1_1 [Lachancea meyersii CBS 8951]